EPDPGGDERGALRTRLTGSWAVHPLHLPGHPVTDAHAGAETNARSRERARGAGGVRGGGGHRLAGLVLHVIHAEDAHLRAGVDGLLDILGEVDRESLDLLDLDAERAEVLRGEAEHGLLDRRELGREVGDPHALILELPEAVVDEDHHLVAEPRLDVGGGDGPERPDELVDEIVRSADVPTVFAEDPQLHESEIRVAEDVRFGAPELPVEDPALEVVDVLPVDGGRPEETAAFRRDRCVRDHRSISSLLPQYYEIRIPSMTCTRAL